MQLFKNTRHVSTNMFRILCLYTANVIHSMADPGQRSSDDDLDRSTPLSKEAILEQCKTLCSQLKYDYVFMPVSYSFSRSLDL